jgi:hypothetical protein
VVDSHVTQANGTAGVPLTGNMADTFCGPVRPGRPPRGDAAGQAGGQTASSLPRRTGSTGVFHYLPVMAPGQDGTGSSSWPGRPPSPPQDEPDTARRPNMMTACLNSSSSRYRLPARSRFPWRLSLRLGRRPWKRRPERRAGTADSAGQRRNRPRRGGPGSWLEP